MPRRPSGSGRSDIVGPSSLGDAGRAVLFSATPGLELWNVDDRLGTVFLGEIAEGPGSSSPEVFTAAGSFVYFTANDNVRGRELRVLPSFAQNLPQPAADRVPTAARGGPTSDGAPRLVYEQFLAILDDGAGDPDSHDVER